MENKFINKATTEYLKSKAGSTIQQQLANIRQRIEVESQDLTEIAEIQVKDRNKARNMVNDSYNTVKQQMESQNIAIQATIFKLTELVRDNDRKHAHETKKLRTNLRITASILAGVIICAVVKSLI